LGPDVDGQPYYPINFYFPSFDFISSVPKNPEEYWDWIDGAIKKYPVSMPNGQQIYWAGPYNWTIQSYLYLSAIGYPCTLTASFPDQGIILAHSDLMPLVKPTEKQFIVEIKPDRNLVCIYANFVIVQNKHDPIGMGIKRFIIRSNFVHYWSQPGLIPRVRERGDRFENVFYMGNPEQSINVAELKQAISSVGLRFIAAPRHRWHDYSDADVIVAVRPKKSPPNSEDTLGMYSQYRKPATKLYNAWLAGVPAILSPDIAYEDLRQTELDYLTAESVSEVVGALGRLRSNPTLRNLMVHNGTFRGRAFKQNKISEQWVRMLTTEIVPRYFAWSQSNSRRAWFFWTRKFIRIFDLL
jgi:hypothetical protein